jgi:hypothetical protein
MSTAKSYARSSPEGASSSRCATSARNWTSALRGWDRRRLAGLPCDDRILHAPRPPCPAMASITTMRIELTYLLMWPLITQFPSKLRTQENYTKTRPGVLLDQDTHPQAAPNRRVPVCQRQSCRCELLGALSWHRLLGACSRRTPQRSPQSSRSSSIADSARRLRSRQLRTTHAQRFGQLGLRQQSLPAKLHQAAGKHRGFLGFDLWYWMLHLTSGIEPGYLIPQR